MSIRYINPLELFRQLELEMLSQGESAFTAVYFQPPVDVYETHAALVIKMELAGVRPNRLQIELTGEDRELTITGERIEFQEEHRDRIRCYQLEIYFGKFQRTIALPGSINIDRDNITANYRDGFLVISLPKQTAKTPERRIIEIEMA